MKLNTFFVRVKQPGLPMVHEPLPPLQAFLFKTAHMRAYLNFSLSMSYVLPHPQLSIFPGPSVPIRPSGWISRPGLRRVTIIAPLHPVGDTSQIHMPAQSVTQPPPPQIKEQTAPLSEAWNSKPTAECAGAALVNLQNLHALSRLLLLILVFILCVL